LASTDTKSKGIETMVENGTRKVLWIVFAVWLAAAPTAVGGWPRAYYNVTTVSPSQRYVLTATRQKNPGKHPGKHPDRAWPGYFEYVLTDAETKDVAWTRCQPPRESSPLRAFVTDDRQAVIWIDGLGGRLAFLGRDGRKTAQLDIFSDLFTREERETRVVHSSSGSAWGNSHGYVISHGQVTFFVIRTAWDRRIVVDLQTKQPIRPSSTLDTALDDEEKRFVLATLKEVPADGLSPGPGGCVCRPMFMAIHMAGRLQVREAIPLLRDVEASSHVDCSYFAGEFYREGKNTRFFWNTCGFRRAAQVALRRLGERPRPLPTMCLEDLDEDRWVRPLTVPDRRERRVGQLRKGATLNETLDLLGTPDYVDCGGVDDTWWRYDLDADPPYTLILTWRDGRLGHLQKKTPPVWQGERRCEGDSSTENDWNDEVAPKAEEREGHAAGEGGVGSRER